MTTKKIKYQNFYRFCKNVFDDVYVYRDETFAHRTFDAIVFHLSGIFGDVNQSLLEAKKKAFEELNKIGLMEFLANECIENYFSKGVSVVKQIRKFLYKNGINVGNSVSFDFINMPYKFRVRIMPQEKWGLIGNGIYESKKTCYNYVNGEHRDALLFLLAAGVIPLEIEWFNGFRNNKPEYILGRAFLGGMGKRNKDEFYEEYDVEQFIFYVFNVYYSNGKSSNSYEIAKGIAKLLSQKLGVKYTCYFIGTPLMGVDIPDVYYNNDATVIFPVIDNVTDFIEYNNIMGLRYNYKWLMWNRFMTGEIVYGNYSRAKSYVLSAYGYDYEANRRNCVFEYPKTIDTDNKCDVCRKGGFGYLYMCAYHERMECKECYHKLHKCDKCGNWVYDASSCDYCTA